ncbi:MAG: MarR family transcriptional regulator [Terrisporobacter othiniensis]|uniref:MarR family winged helix-turn-helix transcriptional regulator n=1 Tax=Terrisporobacter petrolearius TaxID=1460447 RepID=UPI0022E7E009|nr:MarR family transcriptional regulator [Terrisporobacter petrolearius]MDU4859952.1 MarR family transcriptional regulator [Terrisporobacter othiniensis]MDU6996402.1 MarR family transcriptional regulator [Terrisporobacter othiniensis]
MTYRMLGKYLSDLNRDFIKHSELKLSEYRLTLNMWRCMMIIENNKSCNLKDIALSLNVDNAIITRNIKKLEDLNYVVKVKRLNDNRFFDLCLTDEGISILKLTNEYQEKWYEKVIKNFNKEESDTLINLLNKLCSNI